MIAFTKDDLQCTKEKRFLKVQKWMPSKEK